MRWLARDEVDVRVATAGSSNVTVGGSSAVVPGLILEAAAQLESGDPATGYIFFMTDDVPYEDALSITLTDLALRPLDQARLGGIYSTGAWRNPAIDAPGKIGFDFIDEKRWTVTILCRPAARITLPREPRGTHRSLALTSHFVVSAHGAGDDEH